MKVSKLLGLGAACMVLATSARAATINFHIAAGTGSSPWNTQAQMITAAIGDTVHIVNDDTINHRLHTNGDPCAHGPEMAPGDSYDCVIATAFDATTDSGPLYDHDFGPSASFWLSAQ